MESFGSVTNPFFSTSRPGFPLWAHQSGLQSPVISQDSHSQYQPSCPPARSLPSFGLAGSALCSLNFFFPSVLPLPSPLVPLSSPQPKKKFKRCRVRPSAHDLSIISITHARFSPIACKCSIASIRYLVSFVHHTRTYHRHTHLLESQKLYSLRRHTHILFCLCSIPGHPSIFSCIRGASHRTAATSPSAPACQPACLPVCLSAQRNHPLAFIHISQLLSHHQQAVSCPGPSTTASYPSSLSSLYRFNTLARSCRPRTFLVEFFKHSFCCPLTGLYACQLDYNNIYSLYYFYFYHCYYYYYYYYYSLFFITHRHCSELLLLLLKRSSTTPERGTKEERARKRVLT